jgi:hypothetical protein
MAIHTRCGSPKLRGGEIFPLEVLLGSTSRMKSADVIFSAERRIGWFACPIFLREATARCEVSDRPNRISGYAVRRSYR